MEVWILRGTDPETLEEKINKQLEEVEKVKSLFHTPCVQRSWTTLAGVSPVTVIASEPCS